MVAVNWHHKRNGLCPGASCHWTRVHIATCLYIYIYIYMGYDIQVDELLLHVIMWVSIY